MMMKKKRTWFIIVVIVLVAAGGVYAATRPATGQAGTAPRLANAETTKVIRTTLANSVEATGSVSPESRVPLAFGTSGTVTDVKVQPGDRVKAGEVLARLDATDLQLKVTQAEQAYLLQQLTYSGTIEADPGDVAAAQASYDSAVAAYGAARQDYAGQANKQTTQCSQLTNAQAALDRAQTAYDRVANDHQARNYLVVGGQFYPLVQALSDAQSAYDQAVSNCNVAKLNLNDSSLRSTQAQVQTAQAKLEELISPRTEKQIQARARLEQARLSLEQARRNLADATLVAPFEGVITAVKITVGGSSGSGAAIELAATRQLHVDVLIDETQIELIQPGQPVELTLDAMAGVTLTGKVDRINPAGTISQGVVNYTVRVNLDPTDAPLRLDMTANANILGEKHENVLAVPTTAIRSGFGGQRAQGGAQGTQPNQSGGTDNQGAAGGQGGQRRTGSIVLVIENGQPRPVQVTVGMTSGDLTEITGDLQEGAEVLVSTPTLATGVQPGSGFPGGGFPGGGGGFPGGGGGRPPF